MTRGVMDPCRIRQPCGKCAGLREGSGEVAERLKAPHSKCGIGASLSGVRIPPSPPGFPPQLLNLNSAD